MLAVICDNIVDKKSWIIRKIVLGCCVMLFFLYIFYKEHQKDKNHFLISSPKDIATIVRNIEFFIPVGYAIITHNPVIFIEYSFFSFVAGAVSETCKYFIHEERPDHSNYRSFPSGHALVAFLVAHFIFIKINKPVGFILYIIGFLISITRIYYQKHWTHDVIGGALISIFIVQYSQSISCYCLKLIKLLQLKKETQK